MQIAGDSETLILDSFAGSGTTAHAVLNMNKADGGHRKFILVEMMDYAESITAERVRRVIRGYGEGKNAVDGTGGSFSYYELGEPLLIGENLNEAVAPEKIREYIWFMETKTPYTPAAGRISITSASTTIPVITSTMSRNGSRCWTMISWLPSPKKQAAP